MSDQADLNSAPPSAPAAPPSSTPSAPPTPTGPRKPDTRGHSPSLDAREAAAARGADEQKFKIGDRELTGAEINEALRFKADDDMRRNTLPAAPDGYQVALPEGYVMPAGQEFEINPDDPVMKPTLDAAKAFAHKHGLSQGAFSELVALYGSTQAAEQATLRGVLTAEREKLGANGPARVDAVSRWLTGVVGPQLAEPMMRHMVEASQIEAFEKIYQRMSSQGGASFSQQHRTQPDANKIEGYESMSFTQKRAAQDALRARR